MTVYQDQYHMADFTYDDYEKIVITQKGPIYICAFNDAGRILEYRPYRNRYVGIVLSAEDHWVCPRE